MVDQKSSEMAHSPWGPSTLPRLQRCKGSYLAITAAKAAGLIPKVAPSRAYNEQGQKEHDACYAVSTATEQNMESVTGRVHETILDGDEEAIERVEFALSTVREIIMSVEANAIMDEPIIVFEETVDPKQFFKTFLKGDYLDRLPKESVAGTSDVVIYDKELNIIYIIDYKFGYVDVEIRNNAQFLAYALGAVGKWCTKRNPPAEIITVCIQPQSGEKVKRQSYSFDQLIDFAINTYVTTISECTSPGAPLSPSADNCMFCELDGVCSAQVEKCIQAFAGAPVEEIPALSDEDLGRHMNSIPLIEKWLSSMKQQCLQRQLNGRTIPGRKLVRGTKHRVWQDPEKTLKFLAARGVSKESREVVKPVSPAQAEKLLKGLGLSKRAWTSFRNLYTTPEGELRSVSVDDPKPEVHMGADAAEAFAAEEMTGDEVAAEEEGEILPSEDIDPEELAEDPEIDIDEFI